MPFNSVAKLIEERGEVTQIAAKFIAYLSGQYSDENETYKILPKFQD